MTVRTGSYAKIEFPPTIGHDPESVQNIDVKKLSIACPRFDATKQGKTLEHGGRLVARWSSNHSLKSIIHLS